MCGICGLACTDRSDSRAHESALRTMSETLTHRGPDSSGEVFAGPVALAARRLSIIDLEHGDQPAANEDGTVSVVQNGEILNYRALRRDLSSSGHRFQSEGDTEVIAHLYEEHGLDFVERLRGMFAIALWDHRRRRLVLARDRFGIKPLVYSAGSRVLSFASDLRALRLAPGFDAELDPAALAAYLALNSVPGPMTIMRDARKLLPGYLLIWEEGGELDLRRYARPAPAPHEELRRERPDELAEELRMRLRDSVAAHLVADVPVGVLLSGGVDSGTLTAVASELSDEPVRTFSIGFTEASFNEFDRARQVARRYGTDHHELVVEPDAIELLPQIVAAFDEPFGDSSALPTFLVSRLAAEHVKAVLSGEGADELFGGYYTYAADRLARWLRVPALLARPLVERLPTSGRKVSLDYMAKRFVRGARFGELERHQAWKEIHPAATRAALIAGGPPPASDPLAAHRARYAETAGAESLARLQDVDLGIYLADDLLVKTDRASMAHSLEARVPFLDPVISEFAGSLRRRDRVLGLSKKRLLRRAVEPLLPHAVVNGRKQGFSAPIATWLRGDLSGFARDVLSPETLRRQGLLEPAPVSAMLDHHLSGRADLSRQIWGLLTLTLWHDIHHRARYPPVP